VSIERLSEIVRVAIATVRRRQELEATRDAALEEADGARPTLLLADDEPVLLMAMAELFGDAGYVACPTNCSGARGLSRRRQLSPCRCAWIDARCSARSPRPPCSAARRLP
jgi:hypothetical protein